MQVSLSFITVTTLVFAGVFVYVCVGGGWGGKYQGSSFITVAVLVSGASIKVSKYCRCAGFWGAILNEFIHYGTGFRCKYQGISCVSTGWRHHWQDGVHFFFILLFIVFSDLFLSLCWLFSASIKVAHSLLCWFQVQVSRYLIHHCHCVGFSVQVSR